MGDGHMKQKPKRRLDHEIEAGEESTWEQGDQTGVRAQDVL